MINEIIFLNSVFVLLLCCSLSD